MRVLLNIHGCLIVTLCAVLYLVIISVCYIYAGIVEQSVNKSCFFCLYMEVGYFCFCGC
jgi:hypothetical protein